MRIGPIGPRKSRPQSKLCCSNLSFSPCWATSENYIMAKRGQLMTLEQIENILGYKVDYTDDAAEGAGPWFYSDLTQVSSSTYQRAIRELEEYNKQKNRKTASGQELPQIYTIKVGLSLHKVSKGSVAMKWIIMLLSLTDHVTACFA